MQRAHDLSFPHFTAIKKDYGRVSPLPLLGGRLHLF